MNEAKWYLRTQDETFGPETEARLVEWAHLGRIQPGQEVSEDNIQWTRVEDVPFLDMRFSIDIGDGNPRGPFNRVAAEALLASGRLPKTAAIVETREPFPSAEERTSEPRQPDEAVEMKSEPAPVEKIVEKEVIREVRVEVPVEKVVEKVVVDETRVKELEGLLEEERRHTAQLQSRMDEMSRNAADAAKAATEKFEAAMKESSDRENKLVEQVTHLEDELRRLPQAASEVADIQAAVYSIMTGEAEELGKLIDLEKREFEDAKRRYLERADRLLGRRREMLKRSGANIEDMTRKALRERPEDPRTAQLRKDLAELGRTHERMMLEKDVQIRDLTERIRQGKAEGVRAAESLKDVTQLRAEVQELRECLQLREKDLLAERERTAKLRQQQATRQQALMARLASLESPSIGTVGSLSTNQSREAKLVKLPGWMRLGK